MRYAEIKYPDIANGEGVRVSLFLQGCSRHCKGCFNPSTWGYAGGKLFTAKQEKFIFDKLDKYYVSGLSILGGEPLDQARELTRFLRKVKERYPNKTVWLWTGNTYENVAYWQIFQYVDVVIDGEFIEEEKDITLRFRGSRNQRIIEVKHEG